MRANLASVCLTNVDVDEWFMTRHTYGMVGLPQVVITILLRKPYTIPERTACSGPQMPSHDPANLHR
jgi:hypothetical protein